MMEFADVRTTYDNAVDIVTDVLQDKVEIQVRPYPGETRLGRTQQLHESDLQTPVVSVCVERADIKEGIPPIIHGMSRHGVEFVARLVSACWRVKTVKLEYEITA